MIDTRDAQNSDSAPQALQKWERRQVPNRANSVSRLHIIKKRTPTLGSLVLQQPRPVRPFSGLPVHLGAQVDSSEDAQYYADSFKGKRRSFGFSVIFEAMERLTRRDSGIMTNEEV